MEREEFNKIILKDKERRLSISRVPKKVKAEFIEFANEEFEGDYGMLLKELWEKYKEYANFFYTFDVKLNHLIELVKNKQEIETEPEGPVIRTMSGRIVKGGKKINGKN